MSRTAFYPGTFDPVTNGHLDILSASLGIADTVVVAIGTNPAKSPLFTLEERTKMIDAMVAGLGEAARGRVRVTTFTGLTVDAAKKAGATILIRGLRDVNDFDYEMQMAGVNGTMAPELRTVLLPASPAVRHITATLVRQIASMGGDVSPFVPPAVAKMIANRSSR